MPGLKRKTIKSIIEKKLADWLKTLPGDLRTKVQDKIIVTGGCIASMLLGETINDFDIYLSDQEAVSLLAHYYVTEFIKNKNTKGGFNEKTCVPFVRVLDDRVSIYVKSAGIVGENEEEIDYEYFEQTENDVQEYIDKVVQETEKLAKYHPLFLSENAITLSDKVQIVIRFYGNPDEIHKNYDYVHATNYYFSGTKELVLRNKALESLLAKNLIYTGSLYPICSLFRMRKFMDRGWRISAGEITKMAFQISELNLKDPKVLKEQLTGVDAAYFYELIRLVTNWMEENPGKDVDASYVITLVDKLAENF